MHHCAPRRARNGSHEREQYHSTGELHDTVPLRSKGTSFWDEPTIVSTTSTQNEAPKGLGKVLLKEKAMSKYPIPKPEKTETLKCEDCGKGFIYQAELTNHLEVIHRVDSDKIDDRLEVPQSTDQFSREHIQHEPDTQRGEATIKPPGYTQDDQTIKAVPMPVTAASLKALDSPTSEKLAQSMDELSISQAHGSSPSETSNADTTYTIDDVDSRTISDVADPKSRRIREPVRILLCLFMKLLLDFSQQLNGGVRQHAPTSGGSSHHGLAAQSMESLISGSVSSSQVSGVKRPRDNEEDEDEGERKHNKTRKRSGQASQDDIEPLACPFNKFNSQIFGVDGNHAYHVCSTFSNVKTAYFKQHLIRTHCMPEYHCDRCGLDCKNPADLRKHRRLDPPCAVKELDRQKIMPEIQDELGLKTRNTIKTDRVSYWFRVYDMIFGRQSRTDRSFTPYYEGPLHEHLRSFLRFSDVRLPHVIRRARENLGYDPEAYNEHDTQLSRQILHEAGQSFMAVMNTPPAVNLRDTQLESLAGIPAAHSSEEDVAVKAEPRRIERRQSFNEAVSTESWPAEQGVTTQSAPIARPAPQVSTRPIDLPTRPAASHSFSAPLPHVYQQGTGPPSYYNVMPADFEHAPFLTGAEFGAVIEDPDLYGAASFPLNDFDDFTIVDSSNQNQETYP